MRQAFEVDDAGYILYIHAVKCDEDGVPVDLLPPNYIIDVPMDGLYKAKWTGTEWIEGMSEEEITAIRTKPTDPTMEDYLLDLDYRLCMIELGLV